MVLTVKKVTFSNGLTVLYQHKKSKSVAVEVMVKVGSNYETDSERGISHLIEHLLFEGTSKRPSGKEIANEIEKLGGDFNAYTSNYKTCYYVKVLNKHFVKSIDVLSDILFNPLFREKDFVRERGVVLKEIDMIYDDPRYYQWILFQKTLFKKHPCKYPSYGDKKKLMKLSIEDVKRFYERYYPPSNMIISIVGDIKNWKKEIDGKFSVENKGKKQKYKTVKEPDLKINRIIKEKRTTRNSFMVLGFKTIPRKNKDSYVLDVIQGILGRGQSGKMFNELRGKRGLAYEVGTENVSGLDYGYFSIFTSIDKKNVESVKKIILEQMKLLEKITDKEVYESKTYIEGSFYLELEDSQKQADQILFWEQQGDANLINKYIQKIKKVKSVDIQRVVKKYFNKYSLVIIEGK